MSPVAEQSHKPCYDNMEVVRSGILAELPLDIREALNDAFLAVTPQGSASGCVKALDRVANSLQVASRGEDLRRARSWTAHVFHSIELLLDVHAGKAASEEIARRAKPHLLDPVSDLRQLLKRMRSRDDVPALVLDRMSSVAQQVQRTEWILAAAGR